MERSIHGITQWTDDFLDARRTEGDPDADGVIEDIMPERDSKTIFDMLTHLTTNGAPLPESMPERLRAFLLESGRVPSWIDEEIIAEGQQLFARNAPQVILALHCASLPYCYSLAHGANVLYLSERITRDTRRRIVETAGFVLDVMRPGSFGLQGRGIRVCQRVRLLHAAMRYHMRRHEHFQEAWGVPINQEDQAFTLMAFSLVVLDALTRLGVTLRWYEKEAYYYAWKIIGLLLGVQPGVLPRDYKEAIALFQTISARQRGFSDAGQALNGALLLYMEDELPGGALDGLPAALMRFLVDSPTAEVLAIHDGGWASKLLGPIKALGALSDHIGDASWLYARSAAVLGFALMERLQRSQLDGAEVDYRIPTSLRDHTGR